MNDPEFSAVMSLIALLADPVPAKAKLEELRAAIAEAAAKEAAADRLHGELAARVAELDQREAELDRRESEIVDGRIQLHARAKEFDEQVKSLTARAAGLRQI